jgi:4-diphosphocytidyl-2-C-methyl-D-erythritol kinase
VHETAYAKINLALHVRKRREDGYHELETIFVFVDGGDVLSVAEADTDSLTITGEFGEGLTGGPDNLVLKALAFMRGMVSPGAAAIPPMAVTLEKNLPVAAGIGGGSADAAAMIRLLDRLYLRNGDTRELVLASSHLGADVGACIVSESRIGTGLGWELALPAEDDVRGTPVLLVNPRVPLSTGPVFKAWDGVDRGPLPAGGAREVALAGRNDLEAPAITLCPVIAEVLAALQETAPWLARMSGSGATCFALYDNDDALRAAADELAVEHPGWWQMQGKIR